MDDTRATILLVEDDAAVRGYVRDALSAAGFAVAEADRLDVARHLVRKAKPALVVLDVQLPDGSGFELCQEIRASKVLADTPVVMLTARGELEQKEQGFSAGADQYLVKPVDPKELLLWVDALLRRVKIDAGGADNIEAGDVTVETSAHLIRFKGKPVSDLTTKEFELLSFLIRKRPQVFTRKYLLSNLWHTVAVDNAVDTHVYNLRKKLPEELAERLQAVPGKGFRYFG
ncbi:MAG: response regulator transcription factor [Elusimicrobia bacterium]|nr:response regulator transcription factor [Elusimicrobiota bacterium]